MQLGRSLIPCHLTAIRFGIRTVRFDLSAVYRLLVRHHWHSHLSVGKNKEWADIGFLPDAGAFHVIRYARVVKR
jgi:hypothetical protein